MIFGLFYAHFFRFSKHLIFRKMAEIMPIEAGLSLPEEEDLKEMSVDDLNSFLNAAVGTLKEETDQVLLFKII